MCLSYGDVVGTLSLLVEVAILYYVIKEFRHATRDVVNPSPNSGQFGACPVAGSALT